MATMRWKGAAQAVAQVTTVQVTAYDAATTYSLSVNGKTVSTIAAGSANLTAAALATAWNSSTEPELAEVTASSSTDTVTLTGDTAGVPFTATSADTGGTGTIGSPSTTTAATGPNHWDNADNWTGGSVPANSDSVYIEQSSVSIKYGLAQSSVTLTLLSITSSFTGDLGLPAVNQSGSSNYQEYRATYLAIGATTLNIGDGPGQGSGRLKIDLGSVQSTVNIRNTSSGSETNLEAVQLKGTHASNVVNVTKGSVAIAGYGGDVSTVATLTVGFVSSPTTDSRVRCGAGVTLTTLQMSGGEVELNSGLTTVTMTTGTLTVNSGSITTLTADGGTVYYAGTGTIATANLSEATLDFSRDMRGRTVTNANLYRGAGWLDPFFTVTKTNRRQLVRCSLPDVNVNDGPGQTY